MIQLTTLAALIAPAVLADEKCLLPVDVMILQDTTGSFHDDLPNVRKVLPDLVKKILVQNPGSYFGAADFKDKPYRDLGEPDTPEQVGDYCYKLASPLIEDADKFCQSYEKLFATAGGDTPEAHFQALANLATDPNVNWRTLSDSYRHEGEAEKVMDLKHETGARLIIMSTDANPHLPGDYTLYNGSDPDFPPVADHPPPMTMTPYPDAPGSIDPDVQCRTYDYPSEEQVIKLIKDAQINVVFLIPHPDQASMTDYDYQAAVEGEKEWIAFNKKLGQKDSFVQYIKADSSDLEDVVLAAMKEVSDYVCNETTTPSPTTTTTTPAATTTTPAATTTTPAATTTTPAATTTTPAATTTTPAATTTTPAATTTTPAATTTTPAATTTTPAATTTTPAATTTTPAATTTTPAATTTTPAATTATAPEVSTEGTPQPTTTTAQQPTQCPCPNPCPTPGACSCPCPEVVIKLRHRPQKMHFDISNEVPL